MVKHHRTWTEFQAREKKVDQIKITICEMRRYLATKQMNNMTMKMAMKVQLNKMNCYNRSKRQMKCNLTKFWSNEESIIYIKLKVPNIFLPTLLKKRPSKVPREVTWAQTMTAFRQGLRRSRTETCTICFRTAKKYAKKYSIFGLSPKKQQMGSHFLVLNMHLQLQKKM